MAYLRENQVIISDFPKNQEISSTKQCFWDETQKNSVCKEYKLDSERSFARKSFVLWGKTVGNGDNAEINSKFLRIIPFVKPLQRKFERCCNEGDENWMEILNKKEESLENNLVFEKVSTNINDCVWIIDENSQLFYRRGISQQNLFGIS